MTQRKSLSCVHEPFGDAFYYGPERLSARYENDQEGREESGFAETTYADVLRSIDESSEDVRSPLLLIPPKSPHLRCAGCAPDSGVGALSSIGYITAPAPRVSIGDSFN